MTEQFAFQPGELVEYDSHYTQARRDGCVTYPTGKPAVIRGTYLQRLGDTYSDVRVGGKPTLVRTDRLRRAAACVNFQPPEVA